MKSNTCRRRAGKLRGWEGGGRVSTGPCYRGFGERVPSSQTRCSGFGERVWGGWKLEGEGRGTHRLAPPVRDEPLGQLRRRGEELDEAALPLHRRRLDHVLGRVVQAHRLRPQRAPLPVGPRLGDAPAVDLRLHRAQLRQRDAALLGLRDGAAAAQRAQLAEVGARRDRLRLEDRLPHIQPPCHEGQRVIRPCHEHIIERPCERIFDCLHVICERLGVAGRAHRRRVRPWVRQRLGDEAKWRGGLHRGRRGDGPGQRRLERRAVRSDVLPNGLRHGSGLQIFSQ